MGHRVRSARLPVTIQSLRPLRPPAPPLKGCPEGFGSSPGAWGLLPLGSPPPHPHAPAGQHGRGRQRHRGAGASPYHPAGEVAAGGRLVWARVECGAVGWPWWRSRGCRPGAQHLMLCFVGEARWHGGTEEAGPEPGRGGEMRRPGRDPLDARPSDIPRFPSLASPPAACRTSHAVPCRTSGLLPAELPRRGHRAAPLRVGMRVRAGDPGRVRPAAGVRGLCD